MDNIIFLKKRWQFLIQLCLCVVMFSLGIPTFFKFFYGRDLSFIKEAITGLFYGVPISALICFIKNFDWVKFNENSIKLRSLLLFYKIIERKSIVEISIKKLGGYDFLLIHHHKGFFYVPCFILRHNGKSLLDVIKLRI